MSACETCRFWKPTPDPRMGECREAPPAIVEKLIFNDESGDPVAGATRFPITPADGWCGCHERKD